MTFLQKLFENTGVYLKRLIIIMECFGKYRFLLRNLESSEDGDSMFLRNVGIYLRVYTTSDPEEQHIFGLFNIFCQPHSFYRIE
jgi:hypothetical protein